MNRRQVILGAGGAGLALVFAGGAWRVMRAPATALDPWAMTGAPPADVRLDALRHAILAPNAHNMQPWQFRLVGDDEVSVTCDAARLLPESDPFNRQIVIGFGCMAELARIAATERRHRVDLTPFPEGASDARLDTRPILALRFARDATTVPDPLFDQVLARRSNKQPYDMARVPAVAQMRALAAAMATPGVAFGFAVEPARVARLRRIAVDAFALEMRTPRVHAESVAVMRIGAREVDATPDGIALSGPMIEGLQALGQISRTQLADPHSVAFTTGLDQQLALYDSAPAYVWITTASNSRTDQLAAGRAWVRLNLAATGLRLGVHPASQALQEYAEMKPLYDALAAELAPPAGARVQMFARIGFAPPAPPTPRWPLSAKLV